MHRKLEAPSLDAVLGYVSPDGQWILFKRVDQVASDIMVVENFAN